MKKEMPEIIRAIYEGKDIVEFIAKKRVVPIGTGAHVVLPKELIGKIITINFKMDRGNK